VIGENQSTNTIQLYSLIRQFSPKNKHKLKVRLISKQLSHYIVLSCVYVHVYHCKILFSFVLFLYYNLGEEVNLL
jgi:hypothetical protein